MPGAREQSQIAAFVPDGVICKKCLASLAWRAEADRESAAPAQAASRGGGVNAPPFAGRSRDLSTLTIGAVTDRPAGASLRTTLMACGTPGCNNVASGWLKVNGRSIRACGLCRGRGGAR